MNYLDRQTFFTALGFFAVLLKGQGDDKTVAENAKTMGGLIEAFCADGKESMPTRAVWLFDRIIASIKARIKGGEEVELPSSQDVKMGLFHRLQLRQRFYVADVLADKELLDSAIVNLLDQEIKNVQSEAKLMVISIQGDPNAFAPYEHLTPTIADIIRKTGKCSKDDVKNMGFSQQELENWDTAHALAQIDLMRD